MSRCFECGIDDSKFANFYTPSEYLADLTVHPHHLRSLSVHTLCTHSVHTLCTHTLSAHALSLHTTTSQATHCCTSTAQTRSAGVYWTRLRYLKVCWHGPEEVAEEVAEVAVVVAIAVCLLRSRRFICPG